MALSGGPLDIGAFRNQKRQTAVQRDMKNIQKRLDDIDSKLHLFIEHMTKYDRNTLLVARPPSTNGSMNERLRKMLEPYTKEKKAAEEKTAAKEKATAEEKAATEEKAAAEEKTAAKEQEKTTAEEKAATEEKAAAKEKEKTAAKEKKKTAAEKKQQRRSRQSQKKQ